MTDATTFLHLSDIHLLAGDEELLGHYPARNLRRVVAKVLELPVAPRCCLITGDLTQDGQVASYAHLRHQLAPLVARGIPILAGLGNHDDRAAFRRGFLGEAAANDAPYYYAQQIAGLRVIMLDSLIPGEDEGKLGAAQLAWLADQLAETAPLGTVVALHHSPAPTGLAALGRLQLHDADALREVIAGHEVFGILAGHCHTASATYFAGTLASTAPAVAFQLAPGATTMTFAAGSGFNLCVVRDGQLLVNPVMVG